ncbi:hypothetical protein YN1HA_22860 [Sulfurisphaera ohwakuensis]
MINKKTSKKAIFSMLGKEIIPLIISSSKLRLDTTIDEIIKIGSKIFSIRNDIANTKPSVIYAKFRFVKCNAI